MESMIYARRQGYYEAIYTSDDTGGSAVFIEFMFSIIEASFMDVISVSDEIRDEKMDEATMR